MDEFRYKIIVELDDEKLKQECYVLDDCYRIVREQFTDDNLYDVSGNDREITFISKPDGKDEYGKIGEIVVRLYDSWLRPYLEEIYFYEKRDGDSKIYMEKMVECAGKYEKKYGRGAVC